MARESRQALPSSRLVMIGGPSGVGKTRLVAELARRYPSSYKRPLSYTTRERRPEEDFSEYCFVDRDEFRDLLNAGEFVTADEAYGNLYGMSKGSIQSLLRNNICPIKEIHPKNQEAVRSIITQAISVLLIPNNDATRSSGGQPDRRQVDADYYRNLDPSGFDLIFRIGVSHSIERLAEAVHLGIHAFILVKGDDYQDIDQARVGYQVLASEFDDALRITTSNFHDLTQHFVQSALNRVIKPHDCFLDIGAGTGWATRTFELPLVRRVSIDGSEQMLRRNAGYRVVADNVHLPVKSTSVDVILASLADAYCFHRALCEIRRVLKRSGHLILTAPAAKWAHCIRARADWNRTTFIMNDGHRVTVPSFTYDLPDLIQMLSESGIEVLEAAVATASQLGNSKPISPAILIATDVEPDIPLVNMLLGRPSVKWEE